MRQAILAFSLLVGAMLVGGCGKAKPNAPAGDQAATSTPAQVGTVATDGVPTIYTDFYPSEYFTRRITGTLAHVVCPVPADEDPIFWNPESAVIQQYQAADLIVANGAGYAKWMEKATLPESRIVDTAHSFKSDWIVIKNAVTHTHGAAGKHSHEGIDGHTWMDPVYAKVQATVIRDALKARWPAHADAFDAGFASLAADLDGLAAEIAALPAQAPMLASHPAYNYLARRNGWDVTNVVMAPEDEPDTDTLAHLSEALKAHPAKLMLWEAAPLPATVEKLRGNYGLTCVVFQPVEVLSNEERQAGDDYLSLMHRNIATLKAALAATAE